MGYEQAWEIVQGTFAYTNHTVLPEALERWTVALMEKLLPRHMDLIYLVNHIYLEKLRKKYPNDEERIIRMSIIEECGEKRIRMAYLAIVCSHTVNGVAALHSDLLRRTLFKDFDELYPGKIQNKTNGVTPRRWMYGCNRELSDLISEQLGESTADWVCEMTILSGLSAYSSVPSFVEKFEAVKRTKK